MSEQSGNPQGQGGGDSLGVAGRMARQFVHSPLSPLLFLACLFVGLLGLFFTPRQEDPQISVPMVDIFVSYPGASAQQVASLATDPLERMMSEISGVEHVYSASMRGEGLVTVQFEVGEQMEPSLVKLYDKLESNMDKIPPGVNRPLVKPKGVDDVPVVTLTLWSDTLDDAALRLVALELRQRLKEVPNTSQSYIVGGRAEQMLIEVYPERLAGYGIPVSHIANAVAAANVRKSVGFGEAGEASYNVYAGRFLRSVQDLESLIVGVRNGSPIYLRDVARLSQGPGEAHNVVEYYSGPAAKQAGLKQTGGAAAVTIAISKKPGSNGVKVASDILARVDELRGSVIPENLTIAVTRDYGATAREKVDELIFKLFVATGAVVVLVFVALGFVWQPALVVALVIPVVILVTVFAAWVLGYTIDRVSLFALIFSIGILVDDAIVVVENIYRRWLMKGATDTETTVDAVAEVGNPTILATFTVIAALLPMGFVSGMMGPYMEPIPALGSVAMLFSLIAAFVFTPWFAIRIRPNMRRLRAMEAREHKQTIILGKLFSLLLTPLLESRFKARLFKLVIWGLFVVSLSLFYTKAVPVKMLPLDNKPEFNVVVNMPDGTSLPTTANVIQKFARNILTVGEVTAIQTYAGTASPFNFNGLVRHTYLREKPWQGDIQVQLLDKSERKRSSHQIADQVRDLLTPLADKVGARIEVVEMPPGPPVLQTMVAEIYGPDAATRRHVAQDMTEMFRKASSIVDVDNFLSDDYDNWIFEVDAQKAGQNNVSVKNIADQLSMMMGGYTLGDLKVGYELEPRYIVLQAPLDVRTDMNRLTQMPILSDDNRLVPLHALGQFRRQPADHTIFHKDLRSVEFVTGEVTGRLAAPIYGIGEINALLKNYRTPDGVQLSGELWGGVPDSFHSNFVWAGEWTVTYETFRDMGLAFMAAMVLIYMLVVWEFGSFRVPGIIMAPIPLTLVGILPGHALLGAEFTATSMIGWIALAGIIVRNSILLVDFTQKSVAEGMALKDAVLAAVIARARPILITALALVAGSSVIITDPIFNGMAISLMFGVLVATLLTLFVIPLACVMQSKAAVASEKLKKEEIVLEDLWEPAPEQMPTRAARWREAVEKQAAVFGKWLWTNRWAPAEALVQIFYLLVVIAKDLRQRWQSFKGHRIEADVSPEANPAPVRKPVVRPVAARQMREPQVQETVSQIFADLDEEEKNTGSQKRVVEEPVCRDDLKRIKGIGPMIERLLNRRGINTYGRLATLSDKEIEEIEQELLSSNKGSVGRIRRDNWTDQAAKLARGEAVISETPAVRPKAKSKSAKRRKVWPTEKDDLRQIKGIGRVVEKILVAEGVTRIEQIANLSNEQIERIGNELDHWPRLGRDRIKRDDWVGQARRLLARNR